MMYSVRLDNNKNNNYHLNFGDLPQVGEWAKYGDAVYKVVSVGAYNNKNIPLPLVTVDHTEQKELEDENILRINGVEYNIISF